MTLRIVILFIFAGLTGCFFSSKKESTPTEADLTVTAKPAPRPVVRDHFLSQIVKVSGQADQVLREAWWVVAGERRPAPKSAFGKVQRAALWAMDGKLATKGVFQCDRYLMKKNEGPTAGRRWQADFFEKCSEKAAEKAIFTWTFQTDRSAEVEFTPQNLGEVLGIGASIFGKKLRCRLEWSENDILDRMSCPNWEQDRNSQIVRLETFDYKREGGALMKLRGKILQDLVPVRKIEADVPLDGKIMVTETELNAPEPEPVVIKPPPPAGSNQAPVAQDPTKRAPVNPDLLQREFSPLRVGAPAAPPSPSPLQPSDVIQDPNAPPGDPHQVMDPSQVYDPNGVLDPAAASQQREQQYQDPNAPPEAMQEQDPNQVPDPNQPSDPNQRDPREAPVTPFGPATETPEDHPAPAAEPEYIPATPIPASGR